MAEEVYRHAGWCSVSRSETEFHSEYDWPRDHLQCTCCSSMGGTLPRERAVAWVLDLLAPRWPELRVHEIAPTGTAFSQDLAARCPNYTASHYFPERPLGETVGHVVNEDAEQMTFADNSLDILISLDVLEHLNSPDAAIREAVRVLRPGGICIFTTPTYVGLTRSQRRARSTSEGLELIFPPEYHGDPISQEGSLVFYHFGQDLTDLVKKWSGADCMVIRFNREDLGIIGEFSETYVLWGYAANDAP